MRKFQLFEPFRKLLLIKLKNSAKTGSIGCLEVLVNHEEIDLDIQNTLEGNTPLHLAVQYANEDHDMAVAMVELLLAAGADPK